jgi:hypothetical protein
VTPTCSSRWVKLAYGGGFKHTCAIPASGCCVRVVKFIMSLVEYLTSKVAYTIQRGYRIIDYTEGGSVYCFYTQGGGFRIVKYTQVGVPYT